MLSLSRHRRQVSAAHGRLLSGRWTRIDPAVASVVAHTILVANIDCRVVNVVNVGDVHIGHGTVVEKLSIIPTSAQVALAEVAKSIVDPAVKTYFRAPETLVEDKSLTAPTPPSGRP